jgi:hypothetical protein
VWGICLVLVCKTGIRMIIHRAQKTFHIFTFTSNWRNSQKWPTLQHQTWPITAEIWLFQWEDNSLLLVFMQLVQQCKTLVTIVLIPKTFDNHYHLDMTNPPCISSIANLKTTWLSQHKSTMPLWGGGGGQCTGKTPR